VHAGEVHAAADAGTRGAGGPLPHLALIQRSFGRHDVTGIQAHTDGAAAQSAAAMGAEAYASGEHVVFGGAPSLHTAAHEAAHVVQQRAGVQLSGGVGAEGDAYERHAHAVADRVVRGESAEPLLDTHAPAGGRAAATGAVQRAIIKVGKEQEPVDTNKLPFKQLRALAYRIEREWDRAGAQQLVAGLGADQAKIEPPSIARDGNAAKLPGAKISSAEANEIMRIVADVLIEPLEVQKEVASAVTQAEKVYLDGKEQAWRTQNPNATDWKERTYHQTWRSHCESRLQVHDIARGLLQQRGKSLERNSVWIQALDANINEAPTVTG
jgi:hypothetical protein